MREGEILGGQYRLCERVGRGTHGSVWRAEELRGGRATVGLKVFHDQPDESEMVMLARLDHPHILRYRATIEHEGQLCLVTDYADGGDAAALLLASPDGLPLDEAVKILQAVAQSLVYLYDMRVVHRDVKPHNVLFVNGSVRLADVGLAKALEHSVMSGTMGATPLYAAPELYTGAISAKADIYAWGVTAFELLTGRPPFSGNPYQLMDAHRHQAPPDLPSHLPEGIRALVRHCLEKQPEARPSAQDVLSLLEKLTTASPPPSGLEPQPEGPGAGEGPGPQDPIDGSTRLERARSAWGRLTLRRRIILLTASLLALSTIFALGSATPVGRQLVYRGGDLAWVIGSGSYYGFSVLQWGASEWFRKIGMIHYGFGNRNEARENFELALRIAPSRAEPAFNLAVTNIDAGDRRAACAMLRRTIDHAGPGEGKLRALAKSKLAQWGCP